MLLGTPICHSHHVTECNAPDRLLALHSCEELILIKFLKCDFWWWFCCFLCLAIIGPPGIQVEVITDSLHLRFLAPKIENEPETWTMKNIYNLWAYEVQYWKNGTDKKVSVGGCRHSRWRLCPVCLKPWWRREETRRPSRQCLAIFKKLQGLVLWKQQLSRLRDDLCRRAWRETITVKSAPWECQEVAEGEAESVVSRGAWVCWLS